MDASALLKSQGWRGKGFSLHPTNNDIGLSKPLLLKRNADNRGVGQKPHYTSDQWWLQAFDQKLKGLDTTSQKGVVTQSVTRGKLDEVARCDGNGKYAGLYASFVRGETIEGTITPASEATATPPPPSLSSFPGEGVLRRRKRSGETKEERRARREAKRLKKERKAAATKAAEAESKAKYLKAAEKAARKREKMVRKSTETKEERRARRADRRARKEERRKRRERKSDARNPEEG